MTTMIKWTEIQQFHNLRKFTQAYPQILKGKTSFLYKTKVKLHGTNAAIQCLEDGTLVPQSRTQTLTVQKDNDGFARWVEENKESWNFKNNTVIFGEWCGKGIQHGVAVSKIPEKEFFVFAIRDLNDPEKIIVEPSEISVILDKLPGTHRVLPWHSEIELNLTETDEQLQEKLDLINSWVDSIEKCDPYIQSVFNVEGTGEGLVLYPNVDNYTDFCNLVFKAKGEKHQVVKNDKAVQANPTVASGVNEFVELVVTEARLEQGFKAMSEPTMKSVGTFIQWMVNDVQKETKDELAAANLQFKDVNKGIIEKSKKWYMSKIS